MTPEQLIELRDKIELAVVLYEDARSKDDKPAASARAGELAEYWTLLRDHWTK